MSQVTHCPSCHTAFKVTPEQLAMSEGWVRCGRCSEVFDALEQIEDWQEPVASVAAPIAAPVRANPDHSAELEAVFGRAAYTEPSFSPAMPAAGQPVDQGQGSVPSVPSVPPSLDTVRSPEPSPKTEPIFRNRSLAEEDHLPPALAGLRSASVAMAAAQAQRSRSAWIMGGWMVLALLLLLALVWHAVYLWRDQVVQQWPDSRPWVERLCAVQGCTLGASRSLEHLQIDQAALSRRPPQRMSFDFVLRNTSAYSAAAPALELSLLGAGDELLSRRVIQASEWPNARSTIDGHSNWPVRIEFDWAEEAGSVTGYRALLFYP